MAGRYISPARYQRVLDMHLIEQLYHPELAILPIGDLFTMSPREGRGGVQNCFARASDPDAFRHVPGAHRAAGRVGANWWRTGDGGLGAGARGDRGVVGRKNKELWPRMNTDKKKES